MDLIFTRNDLILQKKKKSEEGFISAWELRLVNLLLD